MTEDGGQQKTRVQKAEHQISVHSRIQSGDEREEVPYRKSERQRQEVHRDVILDH